MIGRDNNVRSKDGADNNVGSKTEDEMFREHGYRPETSESPYPYYTNEGGEHIEVCVHGNCGIAKYENVYGYGVRFLPFDVEEILACAQLIREMGWADA